MKLVETIAIAQLTTGMVTSIFVLRPSGNLSLFLQALELFTSMGFITLIIHDCPTGHTFSPHDENE